MFASFNAIAASYAVVAFIGVRAVIIDTWLGLIEHLYVAEKPVRVSRRRSAPVAAPAPVQLPWNEILYRGSAATASGAHLTESAGSFRILAVPAPTQVTPVTPGGPTAGPNAGVASAPL